MSGPQYVRVRGTGGTSRYWHRLRGGIDRLPCGTPIRLDAAETAWGRPVSDACPRCWKFRPGLAERLSRKLDFSAGPDGCWLWTGAKVHNGYGHISDGRGRLIATHRAAYQVWVGQIPDGLNVLHRCDVRACCNPAHLWIGTQSENLFDAGAKGRHPAQVKARKRAAA